MSIYIEELENMTLYRKPFFAPIVEEDKRRGSAIFLLTPNLESSKKMMQYPNMINNRFFESYYIEKDITYFINQENALIKKYDQFIHESINMINEAHYPIEFKTPKELSNWMKQNIKYKEYSTLMSGTDVFNKKCGSCHDQVEFEKDVLSGMGLHPRTLFFIEYKDGENAGGMTHSLVYYKENDKIYWFENAWGGQEGIHGPYDSINDLKNDIKSLHAKMDSSKRYPDLEFGTVKNVKHGMKLNDFVSSCLENAILESITSSVDKDYKSKGQKKLSEFKELVINDEVVKRYKEQFKPLSHVRTGEDYVGFLYLDGDKVVGFINGNEKEGMIQALEINSEYQGYGLSKQLMYMAIRHISCDKLTVNKKNKLAIDIYKKYGFKQYKESDTMIYMTNNKDIHESANIIDESVKLGPVSEQDFEAIKTIYATLSSQEKKFIGGVTNSPKVAFSKIYKEGSKPVAFARGFDFGRNEIIIEICVASYARGKGYGVRAVNDCVAFTRMEKYERAGYLVNKKNTASIALAKKCGFKLEEEKKEYFIYTIEMPKTSKTQPVKESAVNIITEEATDYNVPFIPVSTQYVLDEVSLRTHTPESNCVIFFNEMLDEQVLQESGNNNSQMLKRLLYNERIRNNKEAILLYDKIKLELPFIKKTFINYKFYNRANLFIDWSYYTETFFKNNIYKLDKGIDLYFNFINRFLNDKRLSMNGYEKKTVFVPILDWLPTDDTDSWDYTKNLNPISIIYRLLKRSPEMLKAWKDYTFMFLGETGYFKVDFGQFEIKDLPKFLNFIKTLVAKSPIVDPSGSENKESTKAIVNNIVQRIEDGQGIKINNLTGGSKEITPEELDKKMDDGITTKDAEQNDIKKAELVSVIKKAAENSNNTEEAIDSLENGDDSRFVKGLIMDLSAEEDDGIKINAARASRLTELNNRFLEKKLDNASIRDLLEQRMQDRPIEETKLPIKSINEGWSKLTYTNFEKSYNINEDIIAILQSLQDKSVPVSIRDLKVEDHSTSEDFIETWTVECEDGYGQRFTLKFDLPKFKNNRFMRLRGNEKTINGQLVLLPIIKTDEDTVQIVSNYNKIFVRRFGTNSGKSFVTADRLIKTLNKLEDPSIIVTPGNNAKICSKYELPMDYIDLASVYNKIEVKGYYTFYFNQDEIREILGKKLDKDPEKIPMAIDKYGEPMYFHGFDTFSSMLKAYIMNLSDTKSGVKYNESFVSVYESTSVSSKYTYSKASILNTEIPVIVIMGYNEGLQTALKKANITYRIVDKREKYNKDFEDVIKFNDGFLYYSLDYNSSLLMNGLKECNTEDFSVKDMNGKTMWIEFLDIFGGRIRADGLDNFYDLMMDPITVEVCEKYKLPTDYIEVLAYSNMLLADNKYNRHTDITGNRLRTNEIVAGYVYKTIADAYGDYKNQLKRNKKGATMSIKQSAIVDSVMLDPTAADLSILNPLLELESANSVSFKGLSGMNSDRSYSLDKRTFDDSMSNVLGMSTGFAANVGITRQATIDANIEGKRGYIKNTKNSDNLSVTKTLSITEALTPFGTTHDDPFRSAMTFIQTSKHSMRVKKAMPNLVTNGADEALPYLTSDTFAFKAKQNGKVVEKTDEYMIVEYTDNVELAVKSGKKENKVRDFIDLRDNVKKNSDGGFFVTVKLDSDLKVGSTFKKGNILAYDKLSYTNAIGDNGNIAYSIGTMAKVVIMNTDEGFEDSAIISDWLSDAMTSEVVVKKEIVLPKNTNIYNMAKKGQPIQEGDPLLIFQNAFEEEDANLLLKNITDDEDSISELGRIHVKSKITGKIQDIQIYRTVELGELSDSLKKEVVSYEKNIKGLKSVMNKNNIDQTSTLEPDYKLDPTGKLKNAQDSVLIEFYLKYEDKMGVGDKLVYYSALKGVVKDIFPKGKEPYTDFRPDEKIHSLLAISSVNARMVGSVILVGAINKVLIELDRKVKEIMGVKWKNLDEM